MNKAELSGVCRQMRRDIINMTANAGSGHPGGSLSAVELVASVFYNHMRIDPKNPHWADRDRFVLSKGHAAPCYYAVLAELGFISRDEFKNFRQLHSILQGHPDCKKVPGVDASTGSLGQGCSIAVGMALGAKLLGKDTRVFVLCGDGELPNLGATMEVPTVSVYNSTLPESLFRFMDDVRNSGLVHLNSVIGLDRRAALEALWSVGRYVSDEKMPLSAPYGFEQTENGAYENPPHIRIVDKLFYR